LLADYKTTVKIGKQETFYAIIISGNAAVDGFLTPAADQGARG